MKTRKFLSLMFAFAFLISLLPANIAYAADYAGGSGTESNPYLISNLTQLQTSTQKPIVTAVNISN